MPPTVPTASAEQEDADRGPGDDTGQGAEDQQPDERTAQSPLAVEAEQGAGDRDQVVDQVGRRHRRARRVDDADLERDQEDGAGYADRRRHDSEAESHRGNEGGVAEHRGSLVAESRA
jgi:hypothetical protein